MLLHLDNCNSTMKNPQIMSRNVLGELHRTYRGVAMIIDKELHKCNIVLLNNEYKTLIQCDDSGRLHGETSPRLFNYRGMFIMKDVMRYENSEIYETLLNGEISIEKTNIPLPKYYIYSSGCNIINKYQEIKDVVAI